MDANQLWQTALGRLQLQLERSTFSTWLQSTRAITCEDGTLVVSVHSAIAKDWLENRLYGTIQRAVSEVAQRTVSVRFVVQRNVLGDGGALPLLENEWGLTSSQVAPTADRGESHVISRYTFDTFIVGQANRLAHAGCLAVAENPGSAYNPLFIYGGVGLGKTHLLHAIGNHALQQARKTLYVSTETFANEMINAIRNHTNEGFRARYRNIEVLLLDDVQFLLGKERTQEEFFHTFNDLYQGNRQIVLSSDRPPKAFIGLEERLRSRFEWGLTADIQPPDLETRMAILVAKADQRSIHLPGEVIEFIAQQVQSNIRELEGAFNRVLAMARMMGEPLTVQTAQQALGETLRPARAVGVVEIIAVTSAYYTLSTDEVLGRGRRREVAMARQVAMYLTRELTSMSLPQIGQAFGGRDHTTVLHGVEKIAALFEKDEPVRRQVLAIKTELCGSEHGVPAAVGLRHA
jgi:chromosomal replication initiator protein